MAKMMFGRELLEHERLTLVSMTNQPGWKILVNLLNEACVEVSKDISRLDPEKEDRFDEKLKYRQFRSRVINEFVTNLFRSIGVLDEAVSQSVKEDREVMEIMAKARAPQGAQ
jgi:hypothetical protein